MTEPEDLDVCKDFIDGTNVKILEGLLVGKTGQVVKRMNNSYLVLLDEHRAAGSEQTLAYGRMELEEV